MRKGNGKISGRALLFEIEAASLWVAFSFAVL
jgi:hypothetical protein